MRKRTALIVLVILALGLIVTSLSALYEQQNELIGIPPTYKVSYGFPLGWHGYSIVEWFPVPSGYTPEVYWFSIESFLLDTAFWVAISFSVCIAIAKSMKILHRTRASKNLSVINI